MAYFANSSTGAGILGETLTAALNVNAMLWRTGPAATELEQLTLDWLRQMLGLPETFFGTITDTASSSTLYALAAARELHPELRIREDGMAGRADLPPIAIYCSEEAHSSVDKAAMTLGFGLRGVRKNPTDDALRMDPAALASAIAADRRAGAFPLAVVATVGTTSTTAVDPVPAIARRVRAGEAVAPRRRVVRRYGRNPSGAATRSRWMRARGFLRGESPQVAVHADGLFGPLHHPPRPSAPRFPAHRRLSRRARRRQDDQPHGLRRLTGPPLPGSQALVCHPELRRGGTAVAGP